MTRYHVNTAHPRRDMLLPKNYLSFVARRHLGRQPRLASPRLTAPTDAFCLESSGATRRRQDKGRQHSQYVALLSQADTPDSSRSAKPSRHVPDEHACLMRQSCMSLNPVLLSVLHAANIAPISAARLLISGLLFSRIYRLSAYQYPSPFCLSTSIAFLPINIKIALIDTIAVLCNLRAA